MSEQTQILGKSYKTVGDSHLPLLLKSSGEIKLQWGNKFIDLIKGGKVSQQSSDILKTVNTAEEIDSNGIYLTPENDVWLSIDNTKVQISGGSYISFLEEQQLTADQKDIALKNIGFYYDSTKDIQEANISAGIVFNKETQTLQIIKSGEILDFQGQSGLINSTEESSQYVELTKDFIKVLKNVILPQEITITSENSNDTSGFKLYRNNNLYTLEVDNLVVRHNTYDRSIIDTTRKNLIQLMNNSQLTIGQYYRITDYKNSWEGDIRPIIVIAKDLKNLEKESYFENNPDYIIKYDIMSNSIIYMKDNYGNECNYDFLHLRFYIDGWYYTFSNSKGEENSKSYSNNKITLDSLQIQNENGIIEEGSYVVFTSERANNNIINTHNTSQIYINNTFNNNIIHQEWSENTINANIINCNFHGIVFNNTINSDLTNCVFYDNFQSTQINQPLLDCIFKKYVDGNIEFSFPLNNCTFLQEITEQFNVPEATILDVLNNVELKQVKIDNNNLIILNSELNYIPSGSIIMWHGLEIPYGWHICDGTAGTPNLIGMFIKADTEAKEENTLVEYTITSANLPAHSHPHKAHTHQFLGGTELLESGDVTNESSEAISEEIEQTWENKPIQIELKTYSLIFIMKL